MAKRYYNLERETKLFLKRMEETRGVLPDGEGIKRVNEYLIKKKGLGLFLGTKGKAGSRFIANAQQGLTVNNNTTLQAGDIDFSISSFFKPTTVNSTQAIISKSSGSMGPSQREYAIIFHSSNVFRLLIRVDGTSTDYTLSTSSYTVADWYFIHTFHDSTNNTLNIQINDGTTTSLPHNGGILSSTNPLLIGREGSGYSFNNGTVDNTCIHKRLLTPAEKTFMYNNKNGISYLEILAYQPLLLAELISFCSYPKTTV